MIVRKTPQQISDFLHNNQHRMDFPECWIGDEPNTFGPWGKDDFYKDHSWFFDPIHDKENVRFCHMSCCDLIQIAGNQTVPLLNQICNRRDPRILAERGNFPSTKKDIGIFNEFGIPPFSLESRHPVFADFDIIGTTLAFPGFWPNLVKQFRDAGAPVRWRERDSSDELYPLVFCGGQIFAQPGPIYPIVDVVCIGEAEDGVSGSDGDSVGFPTLLLDVIEWKQSGDWYTKQGRLELLHKWARDHKWCYVPRFYEYNYKDPRTTKQHFVSYTKKFDDIPDRPKRRWLLNLDDAPAVLHPIINANDPSMGLGEIEASRSCTGKCSFCAEIYRYAPYREKTVESLVDSFRENIRMSGSTNAFPTGFDFPCYSRKRELYYRLITEVCSEVDTQSSRVDHFVDDPTWAKMAGQAGMRQLAVGVEGNSERLRAIMSKGCTEEKILSAVRYAIENKFDKIKFFMIADWEWETETDTDEIIKLGEKIVQMKKEYGSNVKVRFSWTPLLIEAWTPLMWCRGVVEDKKLAGVYDRIKPLNIDFTLGKKTERNYYYFMQAFHMADPLLADVMLTVADQLDQTYCGAVNRKWVKTMEVEMTKIGLTWDHYFRRKDVSEDFWWDIIDIDIPKKWFLDYYRKMSAMIEGTDPSRVGTQVHHENIVQIGQNLNKIDKSLRLQTNLLSKGQLVGNCDTVCSACMACEVEDSGKVDFYKNVMLPEYWKKNAVDDEKFGSMHITPVDDKSVNMKARVKLFIQPNRRFMPNDFWIASIRRASYMANVPIGKYSIKLASSVHGYKPWVGGVDYLDLGLRSECGSMPDLLIAMQNNAPNGMIFVDGQFVHRESEIGNKGHMGHFLYELDCTIEEARTKLKLLREADSFEMKMKREEYRKGISTVRLNVKDWLMDVWLTQDKHRMIIHMLMKYGEPTPYNILSAVFKMSAADTRKGVCSLQDLYVVPSKVVDFFNPSCVECGEAVPVNILGKPFGVYCLKCTDSQIGAFIEC